MSPVKTIEKQEQCEDFENEQISVLPKNLTYEDLQKQRNELASQDHPNLDQFTILADRAFRVAQSEPTVSTKRDVFGETLAQELKAFGFSTSGLSLWVMTRPWAAENWGADLWFGATSTDGISFRARQFFK